MATDISKDWTLAGMDNPLTIQHALLTRFENETGYAIVDNNNPASVLMEGFASMASAQMKMMDETVRPAIYPARAVTTADLFKHISDYDYVDVFSSPATATIVLVVEKNFILTHSVPVPDPNNPGKNKDYVKMTIPRSTQIHLGDHTFGLYYPIEIRSSIKSGRFTVVYQDHDINGNLANNPLKTLETNVLDFEFREFNGHKLAYINIPVYQFKISGHDLVLSGTAGFKTKIAYSDSFYALRVWADVLTNFGHDSTEEDKYERKELELAVSGQVYDPTSPTVVFTPDEEDKEVTIEVPYVYFMENRIQGTMHVDIYTTEGELNYQVPFNTDETCVIDMFSNISPDEEDMYNATYYAEPFRAMPALRAFPTSSIINGGSNGLDFEQIRQRVIKGVNTTVLQTPDDIDAYFASYGYTATLYRDGITDRIFIVHTTVVDEDGVIAGMDTIPTVFDFSKINEYSTIVKASDSVFTILPSTLYKFDDKKRICVPLTDIERNELENKSAEDKVNEFNKNIFTLSPFHLQVNTANRYPTTISYDMLQVKRLARTFIAARDEQYGLALNTVNLDVYPREGDVADRYRMTFRVARVGFGDEVPVIEGSADSQAEKKIRVLIGLKNDDGEFRWAEAQHVNTEYGDSENATNEIFELILTPNYVFHQANNDHTFQMAFWDHSTFTDFFMKTEVRILLMMKNNIVIEGDDIENDDGTVTPGRVIRFEGEPHLKNVNPDATNFTSGKVILPTSKEVNMTAEAAFADYVCVTEQKSIVQFGSPIDELDQRINLTYSEAVYQTHKTTKFRTIENDIYATDDLGNILIDTRYEPAEGEFKKGYLYFSDANGENQLTDYNIGDTIPSGVFVKIVGAKKLHSRGTLTCMTVGKEDAIVPNKYTKSNYMLDGITIQPGDAIDPIDLDEETMDEAIDKGTTLAINNAPVVPRFTFKTTSEDSSVPTGTFELCNAYTMRPISSLENVWALMGKGHEEVDGNLVSNCVVESVNALDFVLNSLAVEEEAKDTPHPLNELDYENYPVGTFLLLIGDRSEPETIQIGTIGSDSEDKTSYTRLYYKFGKANDESSWFCIAQGDSPASMKSFVHEAARETSYDVTGDTTVVEGKVYYKELGGKMVVVVDAQHNDNPNEKGWHEYNERNPKFYGFAYVVRTKTGVKNEDPALDTVKKNHYVAFLTNISYKKTDYTYSVTTDEKAIVTKEYFIDTGEESYRPTTIEDFAADGSFLDQVYYERKVAEATYEIPDFSRFEKAAWEAHTKFDNEVPSTESKVLEGREYCYKEKAAAEKGYTKWVDIHDPVAGANLSDYVNLDLDTADGKLYYKTKYTETSDDYFGWEQMGNRWPWEVDTWKLILTKQDNSDPEEPREIPYIAKDEHLSLKSDYERSHRYWEYSYDQVILNEKGKPLEDYEKDRFIQYTIDMLQMDAKLGRVTTVKEDTTLGSNFGDDGPKAHRYPTTVVSVLRTHFDNVGRARNTMFTNTRLFFEPVKSLGYADFNVGNNEIRELPLDITMKFRLHVTYDAYEDDILLENMRSEIIKIIDRSINEGYVNCAEIARKIIDETDGAVKYVDILGINGDQDLQTMRPVEKNVRPHLKHILVVGSDGATIDVDRGLTIDAVVNE